MCIRDSPYAMITAQSVLDFAEELKEYGLPVNEMCIRDRKVTDKFTKEIDKICEAKTKEIMEI